MKTFANHRLDGMEPDNLLAFLALLGLLRAVDETRPDWHIRVFWTVGDPPLRPVLQSPQDVDKHTLVKTVAEGLDVLARHHEFGGRKDLNFTPEDAAKSLQIAAATADQGGYVADLWASLFSDAAISRDGKKAEPTPLCLLFGAGHQYFLERLASVPRQKTPPDRSNGQKKFTVSETDCLCEALFAPWNRPDATKSFRWDPNEDVRYALRARNPTEKKTKDTTQHGANRLAAVGLSVLTVAPILRYRQVRLGVLGGSREIDGSFVFRWPIWRDPISLASIRALLAHPRLDSRETQTALGIVEVRATKCISAGRYMNFTRANPENSL